MLITDGKLNFQALNFVYFVILQLILQSTEYMKKMQLKEAEVGHTFT